MTSRCPDRTAPPQRLLGYPGLLGYPARQRRVLPAFYTPEEKFLAYGESLYTQDLRLTQRRYTMRRCIIALLLAAAVIPAAALAANPDAAKSASNDCTALQAKMGA